MPEPLADAPQVPPDWPHRAASHGVDSTGLRWHVQRFGAPRGAAPEVLLLHGTGASTHSWRGLAPLLAQRFSVIVPDLPGHAFTGRPASDSGLGLPGMAAAVGELLRTLDAKPRVVIGHSAGAAIAARLCLDGHAEPAALVSLNGAWLPPGGTSGWFYAPLAKLLVLNPVVPHFFAWHAAQPAVLRRLLASTGSRLDAEGAALYGQLVSNPAHVAAVLAMMARWDLSALMREAPGLKPRLHLLAAERDRTVPPQQARRVAQAVAGATLHPLPGLGHLAHEEDPEAVFGLIEPLLIAAAD